jgi:hypothetical protein
MKIDTRLNLKHLYRKFERMEIELSTPDKFLIQDWYMNLRKLLKPMYLEREELEWSLDEQTREHAYRMIDDFMIQFYPNNKILRDRIERYEEMVCRFTADAFMKEYKGKSLEEVTN